MPLLWIFGGGVAAWLLREIRGLGHDAADVVKALPFVIGVAVGVIVLRLWDR